MGWDLETILWPTVFLLWTVAAIFIILAAVHRSKGRQGNSWIEYLWIAVFSLLSSFLMIIIKYTGFQLSFTTRVGVVSVVLGLYAYYLYRRQRK